METQCDLTLLILAAQFLLAMGAYAAPVTVGPIVITVPEGFEAAQTQRLNCLRLR